MKTLKQSRLWLRVGAAALSLGLLAGAGGLVIDEVWAQQPKTPEQLKLEEEQWLAEQARVEGLSEAQSVRLGELITQLSDPSYDVRENATLEMLLLPKGSAKRIKAVSDDPSDVEAQARARWVYLAIRGDVQVGVSFIARAAGMPVAIVRSGLNEGGSILDEVLQRIPSARLGSDLRIWSLLMSAANTEARAKRVLSLFSERHPEKPLVALYRGLGESDLSRRFEARAQMFSLVTPTDLSQAIDLLVESADDTISMIVSARRALLKRLSSAVQPAPLLDLWNATEATELVRRRVLIELLSLSSADAEIKAKWIEIAIAIEDPGISEAFLSLACREGISEIVDARIESAGLSDRFYSLLCVAGSESSWRRVLAPTSDPKSILSAMTWLPLSGVAPDVQADVLIELLGHEKLAVRDGAAEVLSGHGSPRVVAKLLARARANPKDSAVAALEWHGHMLASIATEPWNEAWWTEMTPPGQARLLAAIRSPESSRRLWAVAEGIDHIAAAIAVHELAHRREDPRGVRLFSTLIVGYHESIDVRDRALALTNDELYEQYQWHRNEGPRKTQLANNDYELDFQFGFKLALAGHEPFRADIRAGKAGRAQSELLLALYPDAKQNGDLAALVNRAPQKALLGASWLRELGYYDEIVDALLISARSRTVPAQLDMDILLPSIARSRYAANPNDAFTGIHRVDNEDLREGIARMCVVRGSTHDFLVAIEAAGQRSTRPSLRATLVLAASSSAGLSKEWVARIKTRWAADSESEVLQRSFEALDAFVARDVSFLESHMGDEQIGPMFAVMAARLGSRNGLFYYMDRILGVDYMDFPERLLATKRTDLVLPSQLLDGAPSGMSETEWARYWRSTRNAWTWDAARKVYTLSPATQPG